MNSKNIALFVMGLGVFIFLIIVIISLPEKEKKSDPFRAIPSDAALILEIKKPVTFWKESSENSSVWQNLLAFENFATINRHIIFLDSLLKNNKDIYNSLSNDPVIISFHKNNKGKTSFLFIIPNNSGTDKEDIEKVVSSSIKNSSITGRKFEHCTINELRKNNAEPVFAYILSNSLFIGSCDVKLIENSAKQLHSETSLLNNSGFKAVYETAGKNSNANIFINHKMLAPMTAVFTGEKYQSQLSGLEDFAQWSALDLNLKSKIALANGYTSVSDTSGRDFLGCFTGQAPAKIRIADIAPASTIFMITYGFSDFTQWNKNYRNYLSQKNLLKAHDQSIANINKKNSADIEKQLLPCIGKEMALLVTAPEKGDSTENYYLAIRTSNFERAVMLMKPEKLTETSTKKITTTEQKISKSKKKGKQTKKIVSEKTLKVTTTLENIYEYVAPGAFEALFGKIFAPVTGEYYSFAGDYIVFANSKNALKYFLNHLKKNNTLSKNNDYGMFSKNISEEANLFIYSDIAAATENLKKYLSQDLCNTVTQKTNLFGNFDAFAFQSKADGKLFYNNLCLISGTEYGSVLNALWDVKLDTTILYRPVVIDDATGKGRAVAVFDCNNNFYILDRNGNINLKVNIDGKPLGVPIEISMKQKEHKQYVFNTATQLHVIDKSGKEVEGFPVKLKTTATAPLTVADYSGDKDYRFLIPCGNTLYNYTQKGKLNEGWTIPQTKNPILKKVTVVKFAGSDCIVTTDKEGFLVILDRKGKEKVKIKQPFIASALSGIYSGNITGKKGRLLITSNNQGKLTFINEKGVTEYQNTKTYSVSHFFMFEDFNRDGEKDFIFLDQNKLFAYNQNFNLIATHTFNTTVDNELIYLKKAGKKGMIGAYSTNAEKIFVIKPDGLLKEGFPLTGSTPFFVESLAKNDELNLIVGRGRHILNYIFE